MAAFPYHNSTFVCDSFVLGNSSSLDEAETSAPQFLLKFHEEKSKSESSSVKGTLLHRKRMGKDESSQDTKGKQRKCRARKEERVKSLKVVEEAATGYIHVRARRGQATDSHSLAERVRREKISERMKLLQSLVPGCDKITGKALMLDEIINYVQSLQYQVEFLSMKLASITPVPREINALMVKPEEWSHQSVSRPLASTTFADMTETPTTRNNYSLDEEDNAVSFLQQQMLSAFSQDYQNLLWDDVHVYDDQIQRQCESNNLPSSFQ